MNDLLELRRLIVSGALPLWQQSRLLAVIDQLIHELEMKGQL